MKHAVAITLAVLVASTAPAVHAGEPAPLFPADLLREAKTAQPAAAAVLRELAEPAEVEKHDVYEAVVLDRVSQLLKSEDGKESAWAAEKSLRAALRYSQSQRQTSDAADDRWATLQRRLADMLADVRRRLLTLLADGEDHTTALCWADVWLPIYGLESPLGDDVRGLWIRHAEQQMQSGKATVARTWLDRIDATFAQSPKADPLRKELRERAESLRAAARDAADGKALSLLQEAQVLWPRLPGLRDDIEKRKKSYQVLYVAVRDLPELLSPALAWTESERQAVELIFESLVSMRYDASGPRYRPMLVERLPAGTGAHHAFVLRHDARWPDGEPLNTVDVRHTVQLLTQGGEPDGAAWHDLLEPPRLAHRFGLDIVYRQGLLDPWAPLRCKVLPQLAHGKPLARADDVEFAKAPIGTGPYQFQGRENADGRTYVVLRANPQYVRQGKPSPGTIREIRFFTVKDGAEVGEPPPHLVLEPSRTHVASLKGKSYDLRVLPSPRVWFLGVNQRRAALANVDVRLALGNAVDRQSLVQRHFPSDLPGGAAVTVNGLYPRGSWATAPVQRVPEELYRADAARAAARKAGKQMAVAEWTLKYPDGDPRLHAALRDLSDQVAKVLLAADVKVKLALVPLPPRELQKAVRERDFDLVYHHLDWPDAPQTLWGFFSQHAEALDKNGSNALGVQDAKLQSQLRSALHHREFTAVRGFMQDVHARLDETMPLIPLWQLPCTVTLHSKLRAPDLDGLAIFGNVLEWKLTP